MEEGNVVFFFFFFLNDDDEAELEAQAERRYGGLFALFA